MNLLKQASAMVVGLAVILSTSISAAAASAPRPQIGILSIEGTPVSGSDISYQFALNTPSAGTLVVKATVKGKVKKGKTVKATLPVLTLTPDVGASEVTGPAYQIPSGFTGTLVLRVKVSFNGKNVGSRSLIVTVTASSVPSPSTVLTVSTNLYDVGFENGVTLDGSIVPPPGTGAVTYTWIQTSGKPVTLSTNGMATTSFTTDAATNFVNMGTAIYNNDIDDAGYTNLVYVTPEHRFSGALTTGNAEGLALDNEQAGAATYGFKLLVSDGSVTRTGLFTVACTAQTPAHPNIPVGVDAFYKNAVDSTNWVLLAKPSGSAATLAHSNGEVAQLRPDVEGIYIVQDQGTLPRYVTSITTITNSVFKKNNNIGTNFTDSLHAFVTTYLTNSTTLTVTNGTIDRWSIITNTAASWTGVQFCAICHGPDNNVDQKDMITPWSKTGHATMAQRGVDGILSSHYSENCFVCHTVGFNQSPAANNGNFFAVQQQDGWKFPSVLKAGNYAAMPVELQAKANIQCESCHGPGSRHPGSPSVSLDVKVCVQCHQNGTNHVHPEQWEISPHSGIYDNVSTTRGINPQCSRCHSPVGFTAVAKGEADLTSTNSIPTGTGPLSCQVCHDPHDKFNNADRHQLRVYDTALLGNPYFRSNMVTVALGDSLTTADLRLTNSNLEVTGLGNSATCITCHNGRQLPTQVQLYGTTKGQMFYQTGGPHDSTAGEAFTGVGMYDYGQVMGNSFHTHLAGCQTCHMYALRAPASGVVQDTINVDDVATPVTTAIYSQFANVLGDHTFKMDYVYTDTNGVQHTADNIAACNQCHASFFDTVESFDFKPANAQDYDGNGAIEGVQTETKGLLADLAYLLMSGTNGTGGILPSTNATVGIPVYLRVTSGTNAPVVVVTNASPLYVTGFSSTAAYYSATPAIADAQRKAVWNWLASYREGSFGVHNTQYSIRLLQTTYTDLSTNWTGSATNTFQNVFTNAFLR